MLFRSSGPSFLVVAAAAVAFSIANSAQATLILDVQIASGGLNTGVKSVPITTVGQVVNLDVYAIIQSAGANSFTSAEGALRSSLGGLLGNLTHGLQAPFNAGGSLAGTPQDLAAPNNDGDLDIGPTTLAVTNGSSVGRIVYRAGSAQAGNVHWIGTASFTVNAQTLTPGLTTSVNFLYGATTGLNLNPLWAENGVSLNANSGVEQVGTPVNLTVVPEPSTFALIAAGGIGLAAWGRRRRRA